jgi:hypothetical protein
LAKHLFEHALDISDYQTASELYRFLRTINDCEMDYHSEKEVMANLEYSNMIIYEQFLHKKAGVILRDQQYRAFLKLAKLFNINLAQFLKEAMTLDPVIIVNWKETFSFLHDQFNWGWPYSQAASVPGQVAIISRRSVNHNESSVVADHTRRRKQIASKSALVRKREELSHLLLASIEGEFWPLSLMLSTMLLRDSDAHFALKQGQKGSSKLGDEWAECTKSNTVYHQFCTKITVSLLANISGK